MTILIVAGCVLALLLVTVVTAMMFRTVVSTNEVHIIQNGRQTTSYGKDTDAGNVYYNWPSWMPKIGISRIILPVSVFDVELRGYEAYDDERLPFVVDIIGFFRIEDSNKAAQRVSGFHEMKEQLESILQGACRTILASSGIETIMQGRAEFGDLFTAEVKDQLKQWGVIPVKTIELMDIRDGRESKVIANIMAKRKSFIEMESRTEVANNNKSASIAETVAKREADLAEQEALQQVGVRTAEKEQQVGISNEKSRQAIESEAKTTTELQMMVKQVEYVRAAEIKKEVAIKDAEAAKETMVIKADAELIETTRQADGQLATEQRNAESIRLVGESRALAAKLLEMASVEPQIALAQEIGENAGYQKYLIDLRQVEANETVGIENAGALAKADLKILANSIPGGVKSFTDLATPEGGASLGASLEQLAMTDAGKDLLVKFGGLEAVKKMIG